jgi:hypothetical protein
VFGVVGPPAGSLAISVPLVVQDGAEALLQLLLLGGMSYLFGLAPALLAGAIAGYARRLQAPAYLPLCAVLGGATAFAFATLIHFGGGVAGNSVQFMALPGALGGLVSGLLTLPLGRWLRRMGIVEP